MLNFLRHIKHSSKQAILDYSISRAEAKVFNSTNGTVIAGPFKGLKLVNKNVFGSEIPKLLGSYEKELHSVLSHALKRQPNIICNIGAAEGYYALGCAMQANTHKVIVFESLESGRKLIADNIDANQFNADVDINGICDELVLWNTLNSTSVDLMLIDIEGAELDILSPRNVGLLEKTELIIESHDFCRPGCLEILVGLFKDSHQIEIIDSSPRHLDDFPNSISISNHLKLELIDEKRPGTMQWLVASPKS